MKIQNLGSFLECIPARLGYSQALDDAVECLCTAYTSLLVPDMLNVGQNRREYYIALRSLRRNILDEDEALSSNTLAAAVLLSWFEVSSKFLSICHTAVTKAVL